MPTKLDTEQASVRRDRFLVWPLICAILFPTSIVLLWAGPFDLVFSGGMLVLLGWGVAVFAAFAMSLIYIALRRWRRALSAAVLPLVTVCVALNAEAAWLFAIDTGENIHFRMMKSDYVSQIATMPSDQGPRLAWFPWGGFVIGHGVVYDESDEVILEPDQRSEAWKAHAMNTELSCGVWGNSVGDHFYIVRTAC